MTRIYRVLIIFLLAFVSSCREDEDTIFPSVVFIEPNENENVVLPDSLLVQIHVTDDSNIESVTLNLVNEEKIPVANGHTWFPAAPEADLSTTLILDDKSMESGTYSLQVIAFDGNNTKTSYRDIEITEIPKVLLGFIAISAPQSFLATITKLTPALETDTQFTVQQTCRMSAVHSLWERFLFISDEPSVMTAYNPFGFEIEWEMSAQPPRPSFTGIVTDQKIVFSTANGDAGMYDIDGNVILRTTSFNNMVITHLDADGKYLYASQQTTGGTNNELTVYYRVTGLISARKMLSEEVSSIVATNGMALVFVNSSAGTDVLSYNPENYILSKINSMNGQTVISTTRIDENEVLVLTNAGVQSYRQDHNNFVAFSADVYSFCRYDPLADLLYFGKDHSVFVVDHKTGAIIHEIDLMSSIIDFQILYNK